MPNYSLFLLTGMFPWIWFTNSLAQATSSYRNNASLVKKVNMQRSILPLSNVVHEMVHFCLALPVLGLFILFADGQYYISWFWQIPLLILLQLLIAYPLALMLALANVHVHDVEYLVGIGRSMLFFLTPIVYPISMVPDNYLCYFEWSPLTALIGNWRSVFLEGSLNYQQLAFCGITGLSALILAFLVYRKTAIKLGELL